MKYFNTTGRCIPGKHYMVFIEDRLSDIKEMVNRGDYFVINRARQYGKTTTLHMLADSLRSEYIVLSLDFQKLSNEQFNSEAMFCAAFVKLLFRAIENTRNKVDGLSPQVLHELKTVQIYTLGDLFQYLSDLCDSADKPVVLMVDEVDSAANNQVFLDFLAQLRGYYLTREECPIFHSVILAGVYDIKNLKLKLRSEVEHKYNSPWNIAADFHVDMSLPVDGIAKMLEEYESEHHTGMQVEQVAKEIYNYTSGYPFLVSAICKNIDERISREAAFPKDICVWGEYGISEAVKQLLKEDIALFGSMVKQLDSYKDLREMLRNVIFKGRPIPFSPDVESISKGMMFGFLKEKDGFAVVANRIFEMRLMNLFTTEAAANSEAYHAGLIDKNQFVHNGCLDMDLVMNKFVEFYGDVFADKDEKFVENNGREIFLMYLKPIINGTGNAYLESATRTMTRTDVIIDYLGKQYVIELKIWRGKEYHTRGEQQLCEYLDFYHKKKGYMLSFNFNQKKETGMKVIQIGEKTIVEAVV